MRKAPSKKGERLLTTYIIPGKATNSFCCAERSLTSLGMTPASPSAQADKQVLFRRASSRQHGLVHLADLLRGTLPGVPPQQFIAPPDQLLPQYAFGKNLANAARDIENVFGIHQQRGLTEDLRQRRRVRGQHRRAVGHGLKRRQAKAFVERREEEGARPRVEHPKDGMGHKAQKADILAQARAHYCPAQVRMLGERVADYQQLQAGELRMIAQFGLDYGKGFDQPREVFLRLDVAGIEHKRIVYRVAFQDAVAVGIGEERLAHEALVEGVVDHLDLR